MQSTTYKRYLLILLTVILAFNFVDRLALGIVLQDIKLELSLSDTQLGFLSGFAFALFYAVMGIPIAAWADRGNRVTIISFTAALWSVFVAMCGAATSFLQLLLVRVGVGVGEAGCIPPAHSLIADNFSREERPRAAAIYALGSPLAFVIGYALAGWLNQFFGWRWTFVILGTPGLVLAVLAWLTLKEPRAIRTAQASKQARAPALSSREVWLTLAKIRTFRELVFCYSIVFFFGYGVSLWQPAFFIRSYDLSTGEVGTWFAIIYGLGGITGTYLGGALATRFAANNERLQLRAVAIAKVVAGTFGCLAYLSTNKYLSFSLLALGVLAGASIYGPILATLQTLVSERMRAMAIAIVYFFANLIGMGLGPLATGMLSDQFAAAFGPESLRYALLAISPGFFWAAWHAWRASNSVTDDLTRADDYQPSSPEPGGSLRSAAGA